MTVARAMIALVAFAITGSVTPLSAKDRVMQPKDIKTSADVDKFFASLHKRDYFDLLGLSKDQLVQELAPPKRRSSYLTGARQKISQDLLPQESTVRTLSSSFIKMAKSPNCGKSDGTVIRVQVLTKTPHTASGSAPQAINSSERQRPNDAA